MDCNSYMSPASAEMFRSRTLILTRGLHKYFHAVSEVPPLAPPPPLDAVQPFFSPHHHPPALFPHDQIISANLGAVPSRSRACTAGGGGVQ